MQNARSIILHPMSIALLLSVAVHAMMLHSHDIQVPAAPRLETGKTTVQLTLIPSAAHSPDPEPPPPQERKISPEPLPADEPVEWTAPPMDEVSVETKPETEPIEAVREPASIDQDATREVEKGVTAEAVSTSAFRPPYPRISRRRGEQGTVTLAVQVLADGHSGTIEIVKSSGYHRLDRAAMDGARKTTFTPALLLGRPVESTLELSYTFRLTDD